MKQVFFILSLILFSSGFAFGQVKIADHKMSLNSDMKYLDSVNVDQKQINLAQQYSKNINLNLNQSLKAIFIKNNGFKKDVDYFKSDENVFENEFGRVKINETPSDRIESFLNIILNK